MNLSKNQKMLLIALVVGILIYLLFFRNKKETTKESNYSRKKMKYNNLTSRTGKGGKEDGTTIFDPFGPGSSERKSGKCCGGEGGSEDDGNTTVFDPLSPKQR